MCVRSSVEQVLKTGVPVIVQRAGRLLKILPIREDEAKLVIVKRNVLRSDPEDLVHMEARPRLPDGRLLSIRIRNLSTLLQQGGRSKTSR